MTDDYSEKDILEMRAESIQKDLLKWFFPHILADAGFNKEEILQIIGNLTEEDIELMRKLITKEITLSVFIWKIVWSSQSKKFGDLHERNQKK